ncbi:hypothetical protein KNV77_gp072 [Klebsiella phage vB_KpnP_P184]|uniref:Uncharacterized protein n=1 Tax=Klebsiella phage vB_KpnP_P184 TaxID=2806547 RepID=A0A898K8W9_9CAUD|nr:hypothetical protein KNV77_gp072 [Klebsiella phage vB_KpnP_P184]QSJ03730.1 hypothetical protein [Klebsiella phage vB_KpnP_P184]
MLTKLLATFVFAAFAAWGATAGFFMYFGVAKMISIINGWLL